MDKITSKIRNYRSAVHYATEEEAKAACEKANARGECYGRKYQVVAWPGAFSLGGKVDDIYFTVERVRG